MQQTRLEIFGTMLDLLLDQKVYCHILYDLSFTLSWTCFLWKSTQFCVSSVAGLPINIRDRHTCTDEITTTVDIYVVLLICQRTLYHHISYSSQTGDYGWTKEIRWLSEKHGLVEPKHEVIFWTKDPILKCSPLNWYKPTLNSMVSERAALRPGHLHLFQTLPFTAFVTLRKSLYLSVTQFAHPENGIFHSN